MSTNTKHEQSDFLTACGIFHTDASGTVHEGFKGICKLCTRETPRQRKQRLAEAYASDGDTLDHVPLAKVGMTKADLRTDSEHVRDINKLLEAEPEEPSIAGLLWSIAFAVVVGFAVYGAICLYR